MDHAAVPSWQVSAETELEAPQSLRCSSPPAIDESGAVASRQLLRRANHQKEMLAEA
jgi:hypothetical protein